MKTLLSRLCLLVSICLFGGQVFAADPSFVFVPASGTQLKMFCPTTITARVQAGGLTYNGFNSVIKYDPANVQVTPGSVTALFKEYSGSFLTGGNLYVAYGNMIAGTTGNTDTNLFSFILQTTTRTFSTTLLFSDINGNAPVFSSATDDKLALIGTIPFFGADILAGVSDATYNFVPWPCVADTTAPSFPSTSFVPSANATTIPSNQTVSFLVYDSTLANGHYWYGGNSTGNINNYVSAPGTVDNQEGVNESTIRATVSCAGCSAGSWPYVLTQGGGLSITPWGGDGSRNQYTWNSQTRGYTVSFAAPSPYEVEKQITVSLQAVDNPNVEFGAVHTGSTSFSFNTPVAPTITYLYPTQGQVFVSPQKTTPLTLRLADAWAGINTGSVSITIPAIYSGAELLMTGHTYSPSELGFTLSGGSAGIGNAGSYVVSLNPLWNFPSNTGIVVTGTYADLAGTTSTFTLNFSTRPDCSYFGCNEILSVSILSGAFAGLTSFTGSALVITGTNPYSPYPYFTGTNNEYVVCGYAWTGAVWSGNVDMFDQAGSTLQGKAFTGNRLYITGLNFTVTNGVIIVQ